jgi:hypothetical protein
MAAVYAGRSGADVVVLERNTTAGRKLLRTGGGRCNVTHEATVEEFLRSCEPYGRFLKHSVYTLSPAAVREFFGERGLGTKVEGSGCVFPVTDRATDVKNVLLAEAKGAGVRILYGQRVQKVEKTEAGFVVHCEKESVQCRAVIVATGGASWPDTGSTGDGYRIAESFGHKVVEPCAALVPLVTKEKWCRKLSGIGIETVDIRVKAGGDKPVSATGAMMFTHDGIGGPAVFDISRKLSRVLHESKGPVEAAVDMCVSMSRSDLEGRMIALCGEHPKKRVSAVMCEFIPKALAEQLCGMAGCGDVTGAQLSKGKRAELVDMMKSLVLQVICTRPIEEATVTTGGVDTAEIDPKTMGSRLCAGLFFAGEVVDIDGPCGGYNLQIAWSTGALAGTSAACGCR